MVERGPKQAEEEKDPKDIKIKNRKGVMWCNRGELIGGDRPSGPGSKNNSRQKKGKGGLGTSGRNTKRGGWK